MKVRKAVIPAAGYGTRFLPIAKSVPKEMLPLVDKPVIQHVVEEAVASGITADAGGSQSTFSAPIMCPHSTAMSRERNSNVRRL